MLTDPPYKKQRNQRDENVVDDRSTEADMVALVDMCRDIMREGAHTYMFCSMLEFGDWYDLLRTAGKGVRAISI